MSTTTTNFGLVKPELTDVADITAMNTNWDIIDEALQTSANSTVELIPWERGVNIKDLGTGYFYLDTKLEEGDQAAMGLPERYGTEWVGMYVTIRGSEDCYHYEAYIRDWYNDYLWHAILGSEITWMQIYTSVAPPTAEKVGAQPFYKSVGELNMSADDFDAADMKTNFSKIMSAMPIYSKFESQCSSSGVIGLSIKAQIKTDLGIEISSYWDVICEKTSVNNLQIFLYPTTTTNSRYREAFTCVLSYVSSTYRLSPIVRLRHTDDTLATTIQSLMSGGKLSMIKKIQRGTGTIESEESSVNITLSGFTNLDKMMVLLDGATETSYNTSGHGPAGFEVKMHSLTLTQLSVSASKGTISKYANGGSFSYQVIEFV